MFICLKINGGWFDSLCNYVISLLILQKVGTVRSIRKTAGDIEMVDDV